MAKNYREILQGWLNELGRWGTDKWLWQDEEGKCAGGELSEEVRVSLFTDGNQYTIKATSTGYLGCVVSSRKPRPGEDWTRGSDLADGKLNDETWNAILRDIIAYELKTISDYILNPPDTEVKQEKIS